MCKINQLYPAICAYIRIPTQQKIFLLDIDRGTLKKCSPLTYQARYDSDIFEQSNLLTIDNTIRYRGHILICVK
jgi:hypothetical protein